MSFNTSTAALILSGLLCGQVLGQTSPPATRATTQAKPKSDYWGHDRFLPELTSGDEVRVSKALKDMEAMAERTSASHWRPTPMFVLLEAKMYDEADAMSLRLILFDPYHAESVAALEKFRARAFLAANKPSDALSAAKAYFNTSMLKDTGDAIDTIAADLIKARPDTPQLGREFKRQQVAWTTKPPVTQPVVGQTDDLGAPILSTISVDPKPYEAALHKFDKDDYRSLVARGNLLLAADRTKEAHAAFEQAYLVVPEEKAAEAIENVARSIRAESGCIAPANAYILSERSDAAGASK